MSETPRTDGERPVNMGVRREFARQLERELAEQVERAESFVALAETYKRKLAEARDRLADIDEAHKQVMEEKCAGDEQHCTCVPFLRREIAGLKKELTEARADNTKLCGGTPYRGCTGSALALAKQFHEIYERLAPSFGYVTRPDTRAFDPDSANGRLMVSVCQEIIEPNTAISSRGHGKGNGNE